MTMIDPECKIEPGEMAAKFKADTRENYCYCNLAGKKKFGANPKKYLESEANNEDSCSRSNLPSRRI